MKSDATTPQISDVLAALQDESKESLAQLLAEFATTYSEVAQRLARRALTRAPAQLATVFRNRLEDLKQPQRPLGRGAASNFGRALEAWLYEVEHELLPLDPGRAHALAEALINSDGCFYEQADDSDAAIGNAIRAGCRLWLKAAHAHPNREVAFWVERVHALKSADDYGGREALLEESNLLFDQPGLRALASRYEADLDQALQAREAGKHDHGAHGAAADLGMIADALGDPDLFTKITLRVSPEPNEPQKECIVQRYLGAGRPQEALKWLEGDWDHHELQRQHLLADAYAAVGDMPRLREVRLTLFEQSGAPSDFEVWRESLAPEQQDGAAQFAHQHAQTLKDPIAGAQLLLALRSRVKIT